MLKSQVLQTDECFAPTTLPFWHCEQNSKNFSLPSSFQFRVCFCKVYWLLVFLLTRRLPEATYKAASWDEMERYRLEKREWLEVTERRDEWSPSR